MDTRRSRATLDSKKTGTKEGGSQSIVLKRGNIGTKTPISHEEAASSKAESKVIEDTDDSSADAKTNARVLRSKGKNVGKGNVSQPTQNETVESEADESEADESEAVESEAVESEAGESEAVSVKQSKEGRSPSASPPPKRKRRRREESHYVIKEPQCIVVSDEDSLPVEENSSTNDPLLPDAVLPTHASSSSSTTGGSQKPSDDTKNPSASNPVTVIRSRGPNPVARVMKSDSLIKPITIQVKKVVRGSSEGEIQVVTSYEESSQGNKSSEKIDGWSDMKGQATSPEKAHRTYSGPVKKVNTITKTGGKKYMILDKATIKGMMEKGLIQAVGKEGANQQAVTYRAILPKAGPSILRRIGTPAVKQNSDVPIKSPVKSSLQDTNAIVQSAVPVKQSNNVISSSTSLSTSSITELSSSNGKIQVPQTSVSSKFPVSGVKQVITSPVFVKSQASGSNSNQGNVQVVTLPSTILNQIQKGGSLLSLAVTNNNTSGKSVLHTVPSKTYFKDNAVVSSTGKSSIDVDLTEDPDDPEYLPDVELSDVSEDEGLSRDKYGVPTGVCKVLKSMKMYQYVDKPDSKEILGCQQLSKAPKTGKNIRWVAVPNNPGEPKPECGPKLTRCTPPILPINVPPITKEGENMSNPAVETPREPRDESYMHYKVKELRAKQKEQLVYHRKRYSHLLQTYNGLAGKYDEIKDVGTVKQILMDSRKYMKKDHVLFFRNEMMLRDRSGTGHRYSPKFMLMLMKYYSRSPIGYRFLRQIFTLPAVRTLINWQNKSLHMKKKRKTRSTQVDHLELTIDSNKTSLASGGKQGSEVTDKAKGHTFSLKKSVTGGKKFHYSSESESEESDQETVNGDTKAGDKGASKKPNKSSDNVEVVIEVEEQ